MLIFLKVCKIGEIGSGFSLLIFGYIYGFKRDNRSIIEVKGYFLMDLNVLKWGYLFKERIF